MSMLKFKKYCNLKYILIVAAIIIICDPILHACPYLEKYYLRNPVGQETTYGRIKNTIGLSHNARIVSIDEIKRRHESAIAPGRDVLIGFMRDDAGRIQPVFSDSPWFKSVREIKKGSWNPHRIIRDVPLKIRKVRHSQIRHTQDWDIIPPEVRGIFEKSNILITTNKQGKSPYSVLMAVTLDSDWFHSGGRTGVLLKDGLPIILEINGKEFILEIKGMGTAEGGYGYLSKTYRIKGGMGKIGLYGEYAIHLEVQNKLNTRYSEGNTVRAVAGIDFETLEINPAGARQGYLLRLTPGTIRATYKDNIAFAMDNPRGHSQKISYSMGKRIGEFYGQGFVTYSHPENLVAVNKDEDFIFTDYQDIFAIHNFPTHIEKSHYTFRTIIKDSLEASAEIPGYDEHINFKIFLQGLSDGLEESGKITPENKKELAGLRNFDQIASFLLEHFFAVDYYLAKKIHGWGGFSYEAESVVELLFGQYFYTAARLYYIVGNHWDRKPGPLQWVIENLDEEIQLLKIVSRLTIGKLKAEVDENLQIAEARCKMLRNITPREYYLEMAMDRTFLKQMEILPYFSGRSKVDSGAESIMDSSYNGEEALGHEKVEKTGGTLPKINRSTDTAL